MSRLQMFSAIAAGVFLTATPCAASAGSSSTGVSPAPTLAAWSQRVFKDLDRELRVPVDDRSQVMPTGIAAVKFGCSDSGAPSSIELYKSSGDGRLDRATMRAVRDIATLHPLPANLRHDQQYIVRVLFANSSEGAERLIKKMRGEAANSNAWYDKRSTLTAAIEVIPVG